MNTGYGLGRDNNPNQQTTSDTDSFTLTQTHDLDFALMLISNHRELKTITVHGVGEWEVVIHPQQQLLICDVINNPSKNDIDSVS